MAAFSLGLRYIFRREEDAMHSPEKIKELRAKMIEHLDAAQALAGETRDVTTGYIIECALGSARADQWPAFDPRLDLKR
jgi:hypothetical protein